jgi:uncharacterized protein YifE (UPF0438 family)
MTIYEKGPRLSKIARVLHVGIGVVVQFLRESNIYVSLDPNFRLEPDVCEILEKKFLYWEDSENIKIEIEQLKARYEKSVIEGYKRLLNYDPIKRELDLTGFDLSNFTLDESIFLRQHGYSMELLTLGKIEPATEDQKRFYDFFVNPYHMVNNIQSIKFKATTIQTKVWEKVLLSDEYYRKNMDDEQKLTIRNNYIYAYWDFFSIKDSVKRLNVYLKIDGRSKAGDDETVWVKNDFRFLEKINDKYINSLFKDSRIGRIVYTETAFDSYRRMDNQFVDSKEGILQQVELKKIETEMKINAINNYSADEHKKSLHLDGYKFVKK